MKTVLAKVCSGCEMQPCSGSVTQHIQSAIQCAHQGFNDPASTLGGGTAGNVAVYAVGALFWLAVVLFVAVKVKNRSSKK